MIKLKKKKKWSNKTKGKKGATPLQSMNWDLNVCS
jgi:hypothetical protein